MYPEAGGSSSFARHAFNELVSFVAAWGQMLNYVITVAISAYFVPHYLAVFWPWLGPRPRRHRRRRGADRRPRAAQHPRHRGVGETQPGPRDRRPRAPRSSWSGSASSSCFSPQVLVDNIHLGVAPTWSDFALGIAVGMIAYTGIETISNMAEEAKDAARTIPRSVGLTVAAVLGLYLLIPIVALSAMPVTADAAGHYTTELGRTFADDPILGIVENLGLAGGPTEVAALLRRRAGGGDPADRDQRRPDRRLPAHLLDGPAPPAARGPAPGPPALPHPLHRDPDLRRGGDRRPCCRARPTSWRRCTRSARCSRSRSPTSR